MPDVLNRASSSLFILVPRFHGDGVWIPAFAGMTRFVVINDAVYNKGETREHYGDGAEFSKE
jgi:hypothetical protein